MNRFIVHVENNPVFGFISSVIVQFSRLYRPSFVLVVFLVHVTTLKSFVNILRVLYSGLRLLKAVFSSEFERDITRAGTMDRGGGHVLFWERKRGRRFGFGKGRILLFNGNKEGDTCERFY